MRFTHRRHAGELLAEALKSQPLRDPVVLALPRGGVPVADAVARALHAPLDVLVTRKIGAPHHPEYGVGALCEDRTPWLNTTALSALEIPQDEIQQVIDRETRELERRIALYRGGRDLPPLRGRDVILVDDGLATGATAQAALAYLRRQEPRRIVLAFPVCSPVTADRLGEECDAVFCLERPSTFYAVGTWYEDFRQTTDQEVLDILSQYHGASPSSEPPLPVDVEIGEGEITLPGILTLPPGARGIVVFAHGSGSGRLSPRNQWVASQLSAAGFATLLFDLLGEDESRDRRNVFDIPLLADRLMLATRWLETRADTRDLSVLYFGASTGAAAALWAAARLQGRIQGIVSRGGRPDLALPLLDQVSAPTLLLVGGRDYSVIDLNERAAEALAQVRLSIIPGAGHLFEEPGALEEVSHYAIQWFQQCLESRSEEPGLSPEGAQRPLSPPRKAESRPRRHVG